MGAAFQPWIYTNMETNNFVESWYNQLKTTYLERKKSRRADHLVFILVNDIEPNFISNTMRIQLNIGRMGLEERRRRRRELDAEAINEEMAGLMIKEIDEDENGVTTYEMETFTIDDVTYGINIVVEEMKSCSCPDFFWYGIVFKHMFLLKIFGRNILLLTVTCNMSALVILDASTVPSEEEYVDLVDAKTRISCNGLDIVTSL